MELPNQNVSWYKVAVKWRGKRKVYGIIGQDLDPRQFYNYPITNCSHVQIATTSWICLVILHIKTLFSTCCLPLGPALRLLDFSPGAAGVLRTPFWVLSLLIPIDSSHNLLFWRAIANSVVGVLLGHRQPSGDGYESCWLNGSLRQPFFMGKKWYDVMWCFASFSWSQTRCFLSLYLLTNVSRFPSSLHLFHAVFPISWKAFYTL